MPSEVTRKSYIWFHFYKCPEQNNPERDTMLVYHITILVVVRSHQGKRVIGIILKMIKCSKIIQWWWLYNSMKVLKDTKVYCSMWNTCQLSCYFKKEDVGGSTFMEWCFCLLNVYHGLKDYNGSAERISHMGRPAHQINSSRRGAWQEGGSMLAVC